MNRIVEWKEDGIHYEADQRHAEIIVAQMGLNDESRSANTPGQKHTGELEGEELKPDEARMYRGMVARANYLGEDRSDIQYAVKELSRNMSQPRENDWANLKRLARYLVNRTRVVQKFEYQEKPSRIIVHTDTDFAGCSKTRKSTSGGVMKNVIKTWSSNQGVVALSSREAEYYGLVKGASQGIGLRNLARDLGVECFAAIQIASGASAAIGIAARRGAGKIRHIEVSQLWLQAQVSNGEVELCKISTHEN